MPALDDGFFLTANSAEIIMRDAHELVAIEKYRRRYIFTGEHFADHGSILFSRASFLTKVLMSVFSICSGSLVYLRALWSHEGGYQ